ILSFEEYVWNNHPNPPKTKPEYNYDLGHWLEPDHPEKGYEFIRKYQVSEAAYKLEAFEDAVEFLPKIAEMGFDFVGVSSSGIIDGIPQARRALLDNNFPGLFSKMVLLEPGSSKVEVLGMFPPTYFCDDHEWHVSSARECGHTAFCIGDVDWEDIYHHVKEDQLVKT